VRVNLVVVGDPRWQLMHHGLGIRARTNADVVTLDSANEGFGHSIALRTFDGRRPWFKTEVASEAASFSGDVAAAVVGEPFDGYRQEADRPAAAAGRRTRGRDQGGDRRAVDLRLSACSCHPQAPGAGRGFKAAQSQARLPVMKAHGLLLDRHAGGAERRHDGRIAVEETAIGVGAPTGSRSAATMARGYGSSSRWTAVIGKP
jgi:hypothetical protein